MSPRIVFSYFIRGHRKKLRQPPLSATSENDIHRVHSLVWFKAQLREPFQEMLICFLHIPCFRQNRHSPWSSFPCCFGFPCFFLFKEIFAFWSGFCFFSRDFRGSPARTNPCYFCGSFLLFPKRQGKEVQGRSPQNRHLSGQNRHLSTQTGT